MKSFLKSFFYFFTDRQAQKNGQKNGKIPRRKNDPIELQRQQLWLEEQERQHRLQYRQEEESRLSKYFSLSNSLLGFVVVITCLAILKLTASFSIPVMVGLLLFTILFPHAERLHENWGLSYGLSCLVVLILFHMVAFLLLLVISMASFNSVLQALPDYQVKLQNLLNSILQMLAQRGLDISQLASWSLLEKSFSSASSILVAISSNISSLLSSSFTIFLILLFLLLEGKRFFSTIERSFNVDQSQSIIKIYRNSVEQISFYILLKTIISLITGTIVGIGLWLLGMDFPIVWGLLAFIFNFIPSIGSILHTLLVGLFSLLQFSNKLHFVLIVVLFLLTVQFFIGNYLEPKIQGSRLRLSPVFILLFLYIWGYIWGITGMLLAVPILSVIKIICQNIPKFEVLANFIENTDFKRK